MNKTIAPMNSVALTHCLPIEDTWAMIEGRAVGHKSSMLGFAEAAALHLQAIAHEATSDCLGVDRDGYSTGESILMFGGADGRNPVGKAQRPNRDRN